MFRIFMSETPVPRNVVEMRGRTVSRNTESYDSGRIKPAKLEVRKLKLQHSTLPRPAGLQRLLDQSAVAQIGIRPGIVLLVC